MADSADLARKGAVALAWSYGGALARVVAQLGIQVALARLLGPLAFGQAMLVMLVLGFGWLLADAGFGAALVQRAALTDADVGYALGWVLMVSLLMAAVLVVGAPMWARLLGDAALVDLVRAAGAMIPLQALGNISMSLLRRRLDMKRQQMITVGSYVVGYGGVGIVLAWLGHGAWSLVIAFGAQSMLALLAGYAAVRHTLRPTLRGDPALRRFGFSVMGTNLANWAIDNLDRLVIGRYWSVDALGAYSAAANLSRAPSSMLVSTAQSVVFSAASRAQDDLPRLRGGFVAAFNLVTLLTLPLFGFLGLHAAVVIQTLYGAHWQDAAPLFAAFCAAMPFTAMLSITGPVLWAVGRAGSELKVQLVAAVLLVGGLVLLAGLPLAQAVWLVPALYAGRALLVLASLGRRLGLSAASALLAARGGIVLAALAAAATALSSWLPAGPLWQAVLALGFSATSTLLALRLGGSWLVGGELASALRALAERSAAGQRLLALLGLRRRPTP